MQFRKCVSTPSRRWWLLSGLGGLSALSFGTPTAAQSTTPDLLNQHVAKSRSESIEPLRPMVRPLSPLPLEGSDASPDAEPIRQPWQEEEVELPMEVSARPRMQHLIERGFDKDCCGDTHRCSCSACQAKRQSWHAQWKRKLQAKGWGYPERFCDPPFGAASRKVWDRQIELGQIERLTLYRIDFYNDPPELAHRLNQHGITKLVRMGTDAELALQTLKIESDPRHPSLDLRRRESVRAWAIERGWELPEEQIVFTRSVPYLDSREASSIYQRMIHGNAGGQGAATGAAGNMNVAPSAGFSTGAGLGGATGGGAGR
ncbi:MAG: hypothetical protein ACKN9U_25720 [Pirellulaceae bacterium]